MNKQRTQLRERGQGIRETGTLCCPAPAGFTLVEFLVVAALFLIISGGLLTSFIIGRTSYLSADAYTLVQQEARRAFNNMVRELREAGTVTTPEISRLNFQIVRGYNTATSSVIWGSDTMDEQYVHYAQLGSCGGTTPNNCQLIRFTGPTADDALPSTCTPDTSCRIVANNVKSVAFTASDTTSPTNGTIDTVTISLEIEYTNEILPDKRMSTGVLTSSVKLRNAS